MTDFVSESTIGTNSHGSPPSKFFGYGSSPHLSSQRKLLLLLLLLPRGDVLARARRYSCEQSLVYHDVVSSIIDAMILCMLHDAHPE